MKNPLDSTENKVANIFRSQDFLLGEEELLKKYPNESDKLINLKKIEKEIILNQLMLTRDILDYRGNNYEGGWSIGEKRGGEKYNPPIGWIGYGLKVLDKYDNNINNNNAWIGNDNSEGEWCVAYHGIYDYYGMNKQIIRFIIYSGFRMGMHQVSEHEKDLRHLGNECGKGIYCTSDPEFAENYANKMEINGENYKFLLMLRVNPKKIRQPERMPKRYILNPNFDEIRPYRILVKKC